MKAPPNRCVEPEDPLGTGAICNWRKACSGVQRAVSVIERSNCHDWDVAMQGAFDEFGLPEMACVAVRAGGDARGYWAPLSEAAAASPSPHAMARPIPVSPQGVIAALRGRARGCPASLHITREYASRRNPRLRSRRFRCNASFPLSSKFGRATARPTSSVECGPTICARMVGPSEYCQRFASA